MFTASQALKNVSCWDYLAQLGRVQIFSIPFKLWQIYSNSFLETTVEWSESVSLSTVSPSQLCYLKYTSLLLGSPCLSRSSAPSPLSSLSTSWAFQLGVFNKDFTVDLCLKSCSYKHLLSLTADECRSQKQINHTSWMLTFLSEFFNFLHKPMRAEELPAVKDWSGFHLQSFTATYH